MENNFVGREHKILEFWKREGIFEKLREKNRGKERWSFLDGPITANNPMGVHHAWGRTYKDLFQRYKAMQGFDQRWQNGFDCQGLWVEVEVEKELGFKSKKDIEKYGIAEFVEKCKERARKYAAIQTEQSIRLGQWMDWEHSYYTMSDENNYAIWHFLKKCHEQGLLYKGHDVVPWCPRCGTAISQHEILTEEYKEITHKAVFVKFPVKNQLNTYFLVWTTTPWTLPGNVGLAVNAELDYAIVNKNEDRIILLKDKVGLLGDNYEVEKIIKGKEMEGWEYKGIFDDLPAVAHSDSEDAKEGLPAIRKESDSFHKVILWDEVSQEEGTGIVHMAPGCGQEDFKLSKDNGMPAIDLTDNDSNYREGFGELSGKFVGSEKTRQWIFDSLEQKGLLFKVEDYQHRYPTCWRCKSELIFRLVDEWYISMEKLREPLMKSAKEISWIPDFCLERELDWLKNMQDWLISKKRYWGLALPIYECPKCKNFEVMGSFDELKERAVEGWEDFDGHSPHRPWVDLVKIKCSKCNETASRILDVGNPWLDAGIVPFSTISDDNRSENIPYFHNNKKEWQKWFPMDFVCESFPGQFKNWFYVLLVMSQVLEKEPAFKTLLGYASVVDEQGEEMHKSKGNAIWFDEAVEKIGADVMRWMYVKQNPTANMRFGYNVARETERKLLTMVNCYKFFEVYSNGNLKAENQASDFLNHGSKSQILGVKNILDKWIISRLNKLIKEVTEALDSFDPSRASNAIEYFFTEDLSLWYLRLSRKRLQDGQNMIEAKEAQEVFYYVLLTLAKLISPMMPFLAEDLYQNLCGGQISVDFAEGRPSSVHLCDWPEYDEKMIDEELEKEMVEARNIVSMAMAKRAELGIGVRQKLQKLKVKSAKLKVKEEFLELIAREVNVKEIIFDENIKNEVELDTTITEELKQEGLSREVIRQIQDLRKKAGLVPADRIILYYNGDPGLVKILLDNQKEILEKTKTDSLQENQERTGEFLAEKKVKIDEKSFWLGLGKT